LQYLIAGINSASVNNYRFALTTKIRMLATVAYAEPKFFVHSFAVTNLGTAK